MHTTTFIKPFTIFLAIILVSSCRFKHKGLDSRWVFTDLQTPSSRAMAKAFDPGLVEEMTQDLREKIKGNRLILENKGICYGVLLNHYFTGRWDAAEENKSLFVHLDYPEKMDLKWEVSTSGFGKNNFDIEAASLRALDKMEIDSLREEEAVETKLLDEKGIYTVVAEPEQYDFSEEDNDPWNPDQNKWRLKPGRSESRSEIAGRVRNHLYFMYTFFSFILRENRYWVSQDWFFSVIKPGRNGMALFSVKNIPSQWYGCFYDSTQAMSGYQMVRNAFNGKIKIPEATNSYVFNKEMLEQVLRVFDEQNERYLKK